MGRGHTVRLALGRLASILLVAGIYLFAGVRLVLDLIGYSTVPEDVAVAQTRADQFLDFALSVPWWAIWAFILITTVLLIWVSWPRQLIVESAQSETALSGTQPLPAPRYPDDYFERHIFEAWDGVDPLTITQAAYLWVGEGPGVASRLAGVGRARYITLSQGIENGGIEVKNPTMKQVSYIRQGKFGLLEDILITREALRNFINKSGLRPAPFVFKEDRD